VLEGLDRQAEAFPVLQAAGGLHRGDDLRVVLGVHHHRHGGVVLGRRAHQGGTADVDVLDGLLQGAAGTGDGLAEGMGGMPCSAMTASSVPRRPRMPPCTLGWRVFTRPAIISGKPV